jgi:hypothetical protein
MKPKTRSYDSSGGKSQLRTYGPEGVSIELHEGGSVFVGWSARIAAGDFMKQIDHLLEAPDDAEAQLLPAMNGRRTIPYAEARKAVGEMPERFRFIAVDTPDDSFTWEAATSDSQGKYLESPGEVGVVSTMLNRGLIQELIEATATPCVRADVSGIVSSAQRITSHVAPPASA